MSDVHTQAHKPLAFDLEVLVLSLQNPSVGISFTFLCVCETPGRTRASTTGWNVHHPSFCPDICLISSPCANLKGHDTTETRSYKPPKSEQYNNLCSLALSPSDIRISDGFRRVEDGHIKGRSSTGRKSSKVVVCRHNNPWEKFHSAIESENCRYSG